MQNFILIIFLTFFISPFVIGFYQVIKEDLDELKKIK